MPATVYDFDKNCILILIKNWLEYTSYKQSSFETLESLRSLLTSVGVYSSIKKNLRGKYCLKIQERYRDYVNSLFGDLERKDIYEENFENYGEESDDVVWERIVSIELVKEKLHKHKSVYDFSVTGNETFALFSGIVVHNTLNSVDWYEKILYSKDGSTFIEPIGKMIDDILLKYPEKIENIEENRTEYLALEDGYYIPSCDCDGKTDWYKIEAITKHLPVGKLVKVVTKSGRSVTATQSKSFLVWNDAEQKFLATSGSDVKIGDILPTTQRLPKFEMHLQKYFCYEDINIVLDKDIGFLIGIYY